MGVMSETIHVGTTTKSGNNFSVTGKNQIKRNAHLWTVNYSQIKWWKEDLDVQEDKDKKHLKEEGEVIEEATEEVSQEDMKKKNLNTGQEEEDIIEMKGTEEKKEQKKTKDGLKPQGAEVLDLEAEEDEEDQEDKEEDEDTAGRKK